MSTTDEMLRALKSEKQDLESSLQNDPRYQRIKAISALLELYQAQPPKKVYGQWSVGRVKQAEPKSPTALIAQEAEKLLREKGRRFTSGPLAAILTERGVEVPGEDKSKRVSSALASRKKIFNNVPGEGYGLVEWGHTDETPGIVPSVSVGGPGTGDPVSIESADQGLDALLR